MRGDKHLGLGGREGEKGTIRHIGGHLSETGKHNEDTRIKCGKARGVTRQIAKIWSLGTDRGRGVGNKIEKTTRLNIMSVFIKPIVTTFCRSRAWTKGDLTKVQRVANYAVRRAMGVDWVIMREHHISDEMLYNVSGWEQMESLIKRQSLVWLGHVSRMHVDRLPKICLFGWWDGHRGKRSSGVTHPKFLVKCLEQIGVGEMDFFRQAQDRKGWRKKIKMSGGSRPLRKQMVKDINVWRPGMDLPGGVKRKATNQRPEQDEESEETKEEICVCPACEKQFEDGFKMYVHYQEMHSVRDPDVVTVFSFQCPQCTCYFARKRMLNTHDCAAHEYKRKRLAQSTDGMLPLIQGPAREKPQGWLIATDGSGQLGWVEGVKKTIAGWGQ